LFAALLQNNLVVALATAPLAGCLLGFLRYNFNPATIFLVDCGSLSIGFLLGCYGVLWSEKAVTLLGMTAPLLALSVPLLDTLLAIVRRLLRGQPVFTGDRGHIHHRLLDRGLEPRKVALILYACCAVGAIGSILVMDRKVHGLVIIVFCAMTWIGVQQLGFVELGAVGRLFHGGGLRRKLNAQIALATYEEEMEAAPTPDRCWEVVVSACKQMGFRRVEMMLGGERYEWEDEANPLNTWEISIPIPGTDGVRLWRGFDGGAQPNLVAPFAELLRRTLAAKVAAMGEGLRIAPEAVRLEPELTLQQSGD
ncbi:MAG: MraY family glycosyltransferase, partial [Bryobacteraceae bacterium]